VSTVFSKGGCARWFNLAAEIICRDLPSARIIDLSGAAGAILD
jgi:hypothetical protein